MSRYENAARYVVMAAILVVVVIDVGIFIEQIWRAVAR